MYHKVRWTTQKITQRIELVESLLYRRLAPLDDFRYKVLPDPMSDPLIAANVDDSSWDLVAPYSHWGKKFTDFMLRGP